jgi:CheY-like chemotaxis protein
MSNAESDKKKEKKKVLIVDDDADFVAMNKNTLELGGYEVAVAFSGKECMDLVDSVAPDIIILDMMMETWSEGTNVVDKLRRYKYTKDIPIIFVSAVNFRNRIGDISEYEDFLKVDEYLVKPFLPDTLLEHVKKVLEAREAKAKKAESKNVGWSKI